MSDLTRQSELLFDAREDHAAERSAETAEDVAGDFAAACVMLMLVIELAILLVW